MTCDYCGEGDGAKGPVFSYDEGVTQMHAACRTKCQQDQRRDPSREE